MKKNLRALAFDLRNRHFLLIDIVMLTLLPWCALYVRVDSLELVRYYWHSLFIYTLIMLSWKPIALYLAGVYDRYWPFASTEAMVVLLGGCVSTLTVEVILSAVVLQTLVHITPSLPRSLPLINGFFSIMGVMSTRFLVRLVAQYSRGRGVDLTPVLIAGAGIAGAMVVREIHHRPELNYRPVGFVDDDPQKQGLFIHDIPVLGPLSSLEGIVRLHKVREVIIAMPTAPGSVVRGVHQSCERAHVKSKVIPGIFELLDGSTTVSQVRDVQVEDLLRRGVVETDLLQLNQLFGSQRVMVTGAGGSIGKELCRQIIGCEPSEIVLLGHGENSIFEAANELRKSPAIQNGRVRLHAVIADMRDEYRMERVFKRFHPQIIFHAAAHKHVGLMEGNLPDAVSNNILGTKNLVDQAVRQEVDRFVMISTDKAVNPTSIMGATKRIAELIVQQAAFRTRKSFVSVRFGNVLGSRGSVVPLFKAQVAAGGPVIVTHPWATRFFMTIPEAVQLVLQAAALGKGGEVFVLDMGEPIRIVDLARDVIRLSGMREGEDIDIQFCGLSWGEKLHEELFYADEESMRSAHAKIFVCKSRFQASLTEILTGAGIASGGTNLPQDGVPTSLDREVDRLIVMAATGNEEEAMTCFRRLVPQFLPGGDAVAAKQTEFPKIVGVKE